MDWKKVSKESTTLYPHPQSVLKYISKQLIAETIV